MKNSVLFVVKLVSELPFMKGEEIGAQEFAEEHWYIARRRESEGLKMLMLEMVVATPELWRAR